jgi:hypothetical protein
MRPRALFLGLWAAGLLFYGSYLYRHTCFAVGGSDSSGYANAARALVHGPLVAPIPGLARFGLAETAAPVFTPLGFVAVSGNRTMAPLYPVGFPLHVAAAALVAGWDLGPYLVSPIAALLALLLVFLVGRELDLPRWVAAGGAVLIAACPVFVFQAVQPMSDVVAALWCLAAVFAALRSRADARWAAVAGFAFGVAVLVRPLDAVLAVPLLFALPRQRRALALFVLGGSPCAALLFGYNSACFGSPLQSGYGLIGLRSKFAWANFPVRLPRYAAWTSEILTPLVCLGWGAALLDRRIPRRDRALLFTWFGVFFVVYCLYEYADVWWYTRFLLPGLPALVLGFLLVARDLAAAGSKGPAAPRRWVVAAAVVAIAMAAVLGFRATRRLGVLELWQAQAAFPESCRWAGETLPSGALVLSMEMSGALRYYTSLTPVRWDALDAASFQELKSRTDRSGAPWFALLMRHEVPLAAPRVPGPWVYLGERGGVSLWRLEGGGP